MTEVATVAVRARGSGDDHTADFGFVARVPYHRTELVDSVSELAVISVRTSSRLLPLVAELRLRHPLTVYLKLQCISLSFRRHTHLLSYRVGTELTRLTTRTAISMAHHLEISRRADGDALRQRVSLRIAPPPRLATEIGDLLAVTDVRRRDGGGRRRSGDVDELEEIDVLLAKRVVLAAERVELRHQRLEAGEANLVVLIELVVLEDETRLAEAVLGGDVDAKGRRGGGVRRRRREGERVGKLRFRREDRVVERGEARGEIFLVLFGDAFVRLR